MQIIRNVFEAIGNTPLWEIGCLSRATRCRIFIKAEFCNPGGSIKDRAARSMILDAEARGILDPRNPAKYGITEETGGNTGIALAMLCRQRGYRCILAVQEGMEASKLRIMERLGAQIITCPKDVGVDDPDHYTNKPRSIAAANPGFYFTKQSDNWANPMAHIDTTGPEAWSQVSSLATAGEGEGEGGEGRKKIIDGFVCSSGTGGTIAGMSKFLKEKDASIQVFFIDPPGSGNREYYEHGRFKVSEGTTHAEGVGSTYLTRNFQEACTRIDGSFSCSNEEMAKMNQLIVEQEGLFLGPSSAMNLVGTVKLARILGPGKTVLSVACDGGERYVSTLCDPEAERRQGIYFRNVPSNLSWIS
eukprot:ANDGO_00734.mRNA.1 Cysteine synthase 1